MIYLMLNVIVLLKLLLIQLLIEKKIYQIGEADGELIKANQITIRAHRQILNLFASGINIEQIKIINQK